MAKRKHVNRALKQANRAARAGDYAAAERWSKTAERIAAAGASAGWEAPDDRSPEAEALRAELLRRLETARDVRDEARKDYARALGDDVQ